MCVLAMGLMITMWMISDWSLLNWTRSWTIMTSTLTIFRRMIVMIIMPMCVSCLMVIAFWTASILMLAAFMISMFIMRILIAFWGMIIAIWSIPSFWKKVLMLILLRLIDDNWWVDQRLCYSLQFQLEFHLFHFYFQVIDLILTIYIFRMHV